MVGGSEMSKKEEGLMGMRGSRVEVESIFSTLDNEMGLFFPDEIDGRYQEWMRTFSPEEIRVAALKMKSMLFGKVAHLPMICPSAEKCIYRHTCPFGEKAPTGKSCPVESAFVIEKLNGYRNELVVDSFKESEYMLVCRLIELDLFDTRISALLRQEEHSEIVKSVFAGASPRGDAYFKHEENPLFVMKNKINVEKSKILSILVETPEARYKKQAALKIAPADSYSKEMDKLADLIAEMEKKFVEGEG